MEILDKKHAVLGPSSWDRWSTCPGSVVLSEGRPNPTSVYAAEGTVAHEIGATCLLEGRDAEEFIDERYTVGEHSFLVDMEMADPINAYLAAVRDIIDAERGDVLMVEQEVPIGHLTGETDASGTSDVVGVIDEGKTLVVIDLKFGRGVTVGAEGNGQMRMYALGALQKYGLIYDELENVMMAISQPRVNEDLDSETITIDELRAFGDEVTIAAGRVSLARNDTVPDHYLNPSEKACKFCRAKAICPALQGEVSSSMQLVSASDPTEFDDLTLPKKAASLMPAKELDGEQIAQAMRAVPMIEDWIKAVEAEALTRLLEQQPVPGFYLGEGKRPARAWGDPKIAEEELRKRYKVDEIYERKLLSPTKAEKLMKPKPKLWAKVIEEAGIVQAEPGPKVCREGVDKARPYALPSPADFDDLSASEPVSSSILD